MNFFSICAAIAYNSPLGMTKVSNDVGTGHYNSNPHGPITGSSSLGELEGSTSTAWC